MNTYIVIGAPGQGKSPFIHKMIQDKRCFIFDIQNEYGNRTKYAGQKPLNISININDQRARYIGNNPDEFLLLCSRKRNTNCVLEEATAFFEGKTGQAMRKHLIDRFHTGNNTILVFHSINSVPPRMFELCNYVVLFKTLDQENKIAVKFGRLLKDFQELSAMPDGSHRIIKLM